MLNILIVDGLNRSGLAVARALKMVGACTTIHAAAPSSGFRNAILKRFKSNCIDKIHFVENEFHKPIFIDEINQIIIQNNIDALIPIGQAAAVSISRSKPEIIKPCRVLIEDFKKIILFHDKELTVNLARKLEIPHPFTIIPKNLDELSEYAAKASYPAVIKARKGMGGIGVAYGADRDELLSLYKKYSEQALHEDGFINDSSHPLIQEFIPGELHDALVFCVDGEVKAGLTQKRIVTRPTTGGIGVVNITTDDNRLIEYAKKLTRHTSWNGVLMLDFKIDSRDGLPRLLEVNPRFWGTTWLSICAGLNFPHYLVSAALSKPIDYPEKYKVGLTCRWIMDEFAGIFDSPRNFSAVTGRIKGFISRFSEKNSVFDTIPSDIKPTISEMLNAWF
jgi:predicted ATP-grasp superfamily ATP-dependent carboligase